MKKLEQTRKPHCVIQRGNVKVPIYRRLKKKRYTEFAVPDHSTGKRKLWSFADEVEPKKKATEIAEAAAHGDHDLLALAAYKHRLQIALERLMPIGLQIDDACHLIFDASEIISPKQFLEVCRFYKKHQPDKPFTPKLVKDAVHEYQQMPHKVSWKRINTLNSYLNGFSRQFGQQMLHEVDEVELKDFVDGKQWTPKSYNEFLRGVSILYKTAQFRRWVLNRAIALLRSLTDEPRAVDSVPRSCVVTRFVREYLVADPAADISCAEAWSSFCEISDARELPPMRKAAFYRRLPAVMEMVFDVRKSHNIQRTGGRVRGFRGVGIRLDASPPSVVELEPEAL